MQQKNKRPSCQSLVSSCIYWVLFCMLSTLRSGHLKLAPGMVSMVHSRRIAIFVIRKSLWGFEFSCMSGARSGKTGCSVFGPSSGTLPDNLFEPKTLAGGSELSFREFCDMDVLSKKMLAEDPLLAPGPNAVQKRWGVWRFFLASPPTPNVPIPKEKRQGPNNDKGFLTIVLPEALSKSLTHCFMCSEHPRMTKSHGQS